MIYVKLDGRLGNQLFQIAAINSLAARNNTTSRPSSSSPVNYRYKKFPYKEIPFVDGWTYAGYFQNSKYFKGLDVARIFNINKLKAQQFVTDNNLEDFVSVHVRRGDYLKIAGNISLPASYFNRALSAFIGKQIVFTSDDILWVKSNFPGHYYSNMDVKDDLALQSLASYHIISNSSFSWWGSYLAKSKHTIAPKPWFKHDLLADHILEDHWETLLNE